MAIHAVHTDIGFTSDKPLGVWSLPVKHLGPFFIPMQLSRFAPPERSRLLDRLLVHAFVLRHARDSGFLGKFLRWLELTVFAEVAFNVFTHG